jgi:alkylated DNA repair dioxygenase AlkB
MDMNMNEVSTNTPVMHIPEVLIDTGDSKFWVIKNYTKDYYEELAQLQLVEEPPINIMGKQCHQRRNIGFFSDTSIGYEYSRQTMYSKPLSMAPVLQHLIPAINTSLSTNFNGVLVNRYINGEKYIGAHSDDEKALDKNGRNMVVGLAYGPGVRTFRIRDKETKKIVLDYLHEPCTLIVMEGNFQKCFTHEIPMQKRVQGDRISITFRNHTK